MEDKNDTTLNTTTGLSDDKESYAEKLRHTCSISKPMASRKLAKKIYKCIKKGMKQKKQIRSGLKDVQRRIRKGETGLLVLAGDVTPIDVMCHLPSVAEDKNIPYCYTPSRRDLGTAMGVKRGSLMVLIREHKDYQELYDEIRDELQALPVPNL